MSGEITLRGQVLPVGGIKEKILVAKRAGIKETTRCERNRQDVEDINPRYVKGLSLRTCPTCEKWWTVRCWVNMSNNHCALSRPNLPNMNARCLLLIVALCGLGGRKKPQCLESVLHPWPIAADARNAALGGLEAPLPTRIAVHPAAIDRVWRHLTRTSTIWAA